MDAKTGKTGNRKKDRISEKNVPAATESEENFNNGDVRKVLFPDFKDPDIAAGKNPMSILNDIPLEIVVELGRTVLKIKEILELGVGSIVELDKLSGEPVDILINGEKIARGEVVVIDEDFGVRITDVILEEGTKEESEKIAT